MGCSPVRHDGTGSTQSGSAEPSRQDTAAAGVAADLTPYTSLDPARRAMVDSLLVSPRITAALRLRLRALTPATSAQRITVLIQSEPALSRAQLEQAGGPGLLVRTVVGPVATAEADLDALRGLVAQPAVVQVDASQELRPSNP